MTAVCSAAEWSGIPEVSPVLPADAMMTGQAEFNNFSWQQFIALNWPASLKSPGTPEPNATPADFGKPGEMAPVVWETYKESSEVFQKNAEKPTPWNALRELPEFFERYHAEAVLKEISRIGIKGLGAVSKIDPHPILNLSEFGEAFTGGAWLTAQPKFGSRITLFEKRMNRDEFEYIYQNQLYDANQQQTFEGIILPDGSQKFWNYGKIGAIELKAAWIELDDETLWPLFKTSKAWVSYPKEAGGVTKPKLVTVGLVGLHIIHKTQKAQQFVWATFEHRHNAPSVADIAKGELEKWYTYYDLDCDDADCPPNKMPTTTGPDKTPYDRPIQVVRTQPISSTTVNDIAALNDRVWDTIGEANPDSVFLNYQLVNVLWPNVNSPIQRGAVVPLPSGSPQPPNQRVANTTMETYHQNLSCLDCHQDAAIASVSNSKLSISNQAENAPQKASDYSFLFRSAQTPQKKE